MGLLKIKHFDIHGPVFYPTAVIILILIAISFFFSEDIVIIFTEYQRVTSDEAGWFFVLATNIYVIAALYFALGRYGKWFSMLFSAGIGIGLLFYGVAEPISHFDRPPCWTTPLKRKWTCWSWVAGDSKTYSAAG
ncbi:MAG: BCCT family transporter [Lewinella sp.]